MLPEPFDALPLELVTLPRFEEPVVLFTLCPPVLFVEGVTLRPPEPPVEGVTLPVLLLLLPEGLPTVVEPRPTDPGVRFTVFWPLPRFTFVV